MKSFRIASTRVKPGVMSRLPQDFVVPVQIDNSDDEFSFPVARRKKIILVHAMFMLGFRAMREIGETIHGQNMI